MVVGCLKCLGKKSLNIVLQISKSSADSALSNKDRLLYLLRDRLILTLFNGVEVTPSGLQHRIQWQGQSRIERG